MNELTKAFEGHNVTIITDEHGDPWFKGKDVCDVLELKDSNKTLGRIDSEDRRGVAIKHPLGGTQDTTCINESGLYQLIFTSRVESAKRFKKWVTSEVLPSIRKTGEYIAQQTPQQQALSLAKALIEADSKIDTLSKDNQELIEVCKVQKVLITEAAPKVAYADAIQASDDDMLIRDYAKMLTGIGQNDLFQLMRKAAIIYRNADKWIAYASYVDNGWLKMTERPYTSTNGNKHTGLQVRVTGKGRISIATKLNLVYSKSEQLALI